MIKSLSAKIAEQMPRMYRVALRMLGCTEAAEEVAQNVCVAALRGAEKFDGRSDLMTWLHRITINCAHDHRRKRRVESDRIDGDDDLIGALAMSQATPAERAEQAEMFRLALKLVAALPGDCRAAFTLTQLDGYTYDEAAAIENISRGTVASRVYRARKLLMEQISPHLAGDKP
jgi:RNA polymerase sigma-70 factor, ECF subfamily